MVDVSKHIEYLLLTNDEVRVPQFGEFTVNYVCSKWIEEEQLFLPPLRSVSFNVNQTITNDGFLKSLSKCNHITLQEASINCTEYVETTFQMLHEQGDVEIGSLGTLLLDETDGSTMFIANQAGIDSPALYGLDAVQMPLLQNDVIGNRATEQNDKSVKLTSVKADEHTITIKINRHLFNYVAAVAASVLLFFTFATPTVNNPMTDQQIADTNFFIPSNLSIQSAKAPVQVVKPAPVVKEKKETPKPVEKVQTKEPETAGYAIVLASAVSEKNGNRFIQKLKDRGYKAEMIHKGKINHVVITGFKSESEAHNRIKELRLKDKDFNSAWTIKL